MTIKITELFSKPSIMGVVGDVNTGKSLLLYWIIKELEKTKKFTLYTYGLKKDITGAQKVHSIKELEAIEDSVIILDEVMSMWDLDDRKDKKQIEKSLRLLHHSNNIILVCGVPDNFRKFIAGKLDKVLFKKVSYDDLVNGSKVSKIMKNYKGVESGTSMLNLKPNETIIFDGGHYHKVVVPYLRDYDTKLGNVEILKDKSVRRSVQESGGENGR